MKSLMLYAWFDLLEIWSCGKNGHECIFKRFFCNIFADIDNVITGYFHVFTCVSFTTYYLCIASSLKVHLWFVFFFPLFFLLGNKKHQAFSWIIFKRSLLKSCQILKHFPETSSNTNYGVIIKDSRECIEKNLKRHFMLDSSVKRMQSNLNSHFYFLKLGSLEKRLLRKILKSNLKERRILGNH